MQSLPRKMLACFVFIIGLLPLWTSASLVTLHFGTRLYQRMQQQFGAESVQRLLDWKEFMESKRGLPEQALIHEVNDYLNRFPFVSDQEHWAQADYWATPFEFVASNGGDCEDFAIAKYYTLLSLGVDESRLRLLYVKTHAADEAHMVLTYRPQLGSEDDSWVLDNLQESIEALHARTDLAPVYSFNRTGFWLVQADGKQVQSGRGQDVVMWSELDDRLQAQQRL